MRTSHVAIKRLIADEKNRLTDEQLVGSPQFAAYLKDIAEGATKRYRRSSKVSTYWDTSESAEIAHTDNRIIRLNAGNFLTGSFPTKSLKTDSLIGIVAHECGHILYSDFTMLATYQQALSAGRFYPATPEELTARQEKSLQEILESVEDKDAAVITAISHISHALVNLMEDVYIEGRMCDAFPGTMKTGILLNNLRYAEEMETVTAEIDRQHHEVFILINLLIQYAKTGDINNLGGYKGPYLDVVYECIPYVDDAAYDDDAKARFDSANKMLLLLWPYMKSFIERVREDIKNGTSNAADDMKNQLSGASLLPARSGKPALGTGKYKHEPGDDDEEREHLQQALDYETGGSCWKRPMRSGRTGTAGHPALQIMQARAMFPRRPLTCSGS